MNTGQLITDTTVVDKATIAAGAMLVAAGKLAAAAKDIVAVGMLAAKNIAVVHIAATAKDIVAVGMLAATKLTVAVGMLAAAKDTVAEGMLAAAAKDIVAVGIVEDYPKGPYHWEELDINSMLELTDQFSLKQAITVLFRHDRQGQALAYCFSP